MLFQQGTHVLRKPDFTSLEYNPINLVSVCFLVRFPIIFDQGNSEYAFLKKDELLLLIL